MSWAAWSVLIVIACVCLMLSAFVSGSEIAYFGLTPADIDDLRDEEDDPKCSRDIFIGEKVGTAPRYDSHIQQPCQHHNGRADDVCHQPDCNVQQFCGQLLGADRLPDIPPAPFR